MTMATKRLRQKNSLHASNYQRDIHPNDFTATATTTSVVDGSSNFSPPQTVWSPQPVPEVSVQSDRLALPFTGCEPVPHLAGRVARPTLGTPAPLGDARSTLRDVCPRIICVHLRITSAQKA